jgi:hypothetical protein
LLIGVFGVVEGRPSKNPVQAIENNGSQWNLARDARTVMDLALVALALKKAQAPRAATRLLYEDDKNTTKTDFVFIPHSPRQEIGHRLTIAP